MRTEEVSDLLVDVAARIVLPRWRTLTRSEVFDKGHGDLVTVADREAEAELTAALSGPGVAVIGEEAVSADPATLAGLATSDHAWVIDPVDGTGNFARGSADFAVMLAEVKGGETVRSWIWQPVHQRLYVAERGAGVTRNGARLAPRPRGDDLRGPLQRGRPAQPPPWLHLAPTARCCGVEYPRVIEGDLDFLGYRSMKPWDHLPGALMVTELGGRVATVEGQDYRAMTTGRSLLAAATPAIWSRVRGTLD